MPGTPEVHRRSMVATSLADDRDRSSCAGSAVCPLSKHGFVGGGRGTASRRSHAPDGAGMPPCRRNQLLQQGQDQVNVLVVGLCGRCPCPSAISPAWPAEFTDIDRKST